MIPVWRETTLVFLYSKLEGEQGMDWDWERILVGILITAGIPVVGYLIAAGSQCLTQVLKKKKAEARAADKQVLVIAFEAAEKALEAVTKATIGKIESTSAAELREKVKAGDSEFAELQALSKVALEEILLQLQPEIKTTLLQCIGDLDAYIANQIETLLPGVKADYAKAKAVQGIAVKINIDGDKDKILDEMDKVNVEVVQEA